MKYKKTVIRILLILNIFAYAFISPVISQVSFPDSILLTLKKEHPWLLVNSLNDFQKIKNRSITDYFLKQSIKNILANAETMAKTDGRNNQP